MHEMIYRNKEKIMTMHKKKNNEKSVPGIL